MWPQCPNPRDKLPTTLFSRGLNNLKTPQPCVNYTEQSCLVQMAVYSQPYTMIMTWLEWEVRVLVASERMVAIDCRMSVLSWLDGHCDNTAGSCATHLAIYSRAGGDATPSWYAIVAMNSVQVLLFVGRLSKKYVARDIHSLACCSATACAIEGEHKGPWTHSIFPTPLVSLIQCSTFETICSRSSASFPWLDCRWPEL